MTSKTALLVLDMQRDFCEPDGALHDLVAGELDRTGVVPATVRLIEAARDRGIPAIATPIEIDYAAPPASKPEGIFAVVTDRRAFDAAGPGSDLTAPVAEQVRRGGVEVLPKPGLSAFAGTDLDRRLAEQGIDELVLCGLLTNFCVESTARDAFDRGYRVRVVSDATATMSAAQAEHASEHIFPMLGATTTVAEFAALPAVS